MRTAYTTLAFFKFMMIFFMMTAVAESSAAQTDEVWVEVSRSPNGHVTLKSKIDGKYHHVFEEVRADKYAGKSSISAVVKSARTGAQSTGTVPAAVTHTVPKSTVFKNLLANAKKGGKLVAGNHPIVRGALVLGAAYTLVEPLLKKKNTFTTKNTMILYQITNGQSVVKSICPTGSLIKVLSVAQ